MKRARDKFRGEISKNHEINEELLLKSLLLKDYKLVRLHAYVFSYVKRELDHHMHKKKNLDNKKV